MIPSDRRPGSDPAPDGPEPEPRSTRGTLPPPEWTATQGGPARPTFAPTPLDRRTGERAQEAWMRARVDEARGAGDRRATRETCAALARWLASRDRDLDEAVELATEALAVGDDVELRRELAAWLESLGEPSRAAGALRPIASMPEIESAEAAYVLVRTGVLKARAGAAAGAAAAFEAAMPIAPEDPLPAELLGALSDWEPESVPPVMAADAYVEAARRRGRQGDADAELEDLWRASSVDPCSGRAVQALGDALERRGRPDAVDEVWREHARRIGPSDPERALVVQARRRSAASAAGAHARALGAALDERLDTRFEGEPGEALDAILVDLGMLEVVAARLGVRAGPGTPEQRAGYLVDLARLCSGPLADDARATSAYLAALAVDPRCDDAATALRAMHGGEIPARAEVPYTREDDGSSSRAATATAWVRAARGGDDHALAAALERVAASSSAAVKAVLLTAAADRALAGGDRGSARRLAEAALHAEPGSARAVATMADVVTQLDPDRPGAAALERAIALVGPRAGWCASLAAALDVLGEVGLSLGWSQRTVALRPGDRAGIERLLERLVRSRDGGRLGDALTWLLSQPQPVTWLAPHFAAALRELASLDVDRGAVIARRTLDVFGPKLEPLRDAMLHVAERAGDPAFAAAVLERWTACGATGPDRTALLLRLADLRERLDDAEGLARVVARTAQEGVAAEEVDAHLARLGDRTLGPDAQLWRLRARAERAPAGDAESASFTWRDLGAALWDLAEDRVGAVNAWQRAARLAPSGGHATLALDLVAFAGAKFAFDYLAQLIETEPDGPRAATIAAAVARTALHMGESRLAFDLAARGITRSPACAAALAIAERAADRTHEHAALSGIYEVVATRALGRFGRRAAHYRGARYFERRNENALALKHAAQAFYAVPSEGSAFHLLARAAERAGDRTQAVRTIEHVAMGSGRSEARAMWLLRAASIAGEGEDGARRRVDVLLRAAVASPNVATVGLLRDAASDLLRYGPEELESLEVRLGRAARTITDRIDGPEGARVALAFAAASLDLFSDADAAMGMVERAFACDADVDEFASLLDRAPRLGLAHDAAARAAHVLDVAESPHSNVGVPVLRLAAAIAESVGDHTLHARAAVAAALREPDDDRLVTEADAAVRAAPALLDRLSSRVTPSRRGRALITSARARISEGGHADAAPLFERAIDLVEEADRPEVERELRAAWDAAGRGSEIEARVQREAASSAASPGMRADRWTEIAERRETRGDRPGAVRALLEACKLDPEPMHRWSALERVAELAGDDEAHVAALEEISSRVGDDGRVPVYKRLARAHERRNSLEASSAAWGRVLALDPDDEEADHAMEALIVAQARYGDLAEHLARRAERLSNHSGMREMLRAVRLRRAAILEQRLDRLADACDELLLLLGEWPDNPGALRYLADLLDRRGESAQAAPLWRRASAVESDPGERDELELRAGRASLAAGDLETAMTHASAVLARTPFRPDALTLRVEVARALGADRELGDALDAIASGKGVDDRTRCDLLVEAAQASARAGDVRLALDRARRAADLAGDRAMPQLLARGLEYRMRGPGDPGDARLTIEELARIREPLEPGDDALRAFLLAEALDVVQGGGAGLRELEATQAVAGSHALLSLGLAERLLATGQHSAAVDHYKVALSGSLLELRRVGPVALAAGEAALRSTRIPDAGRFLAIAQEHEETRAAATAKLAVVAEFQRAARRPTLPPPEAGVPPPASAPAQPVRTQPPIATAPPPPAAASAAPPGAQSARFAVTTAPYGVTPVPFDRPATPHVPTPPQWSAPPAPPPELPLVVPLPQPTDTLRPDAVTSPPQEGFDELEAAVRLATTPGERARARLTLGRKRLDAGDPRGAEPLLWEALADGITQAGDILAVMLSEAGDRARDLVRVRRQQVAIEPGDIGRLESLRAAALADDDRVFARAVEHVLRAFDPGAGPLPPPPLAQQPEVPGIFAVLARPSTDAAGEALALIWEGAQQLFVRDTASYGITGVERVVPGPTSAIARLYDAAMRALESPRVPLFVPRATAGTPAAHVAVLSPPSVILAGDVREETAELRMALGRGMSAALPHNVLRLGLPPAEGRALVEALRAAFGPPDIGRRVDARAARLAESFWQIIPARTQRRLQELLGTATIAEYEDLVGRAHQSGRRVGMFLAGDFACTARALLVEAGSRSDEPPSLPSLRHLCEHFPALADLLRLAVSPEYASARWHVVAPSAPRGTLSSGRFSLF